MTDVLVIEDDAVLRNNIMDMLAIEGFSVRNASNGRDGIELAKSHHPDLIICDIMMPGIDGYGVLEELHRSPATAAIPFIFLTAKAELSDVRKGMEHGADDYITKPFTFNTLLNSVRARVAKNDAIKHRIQQDIDRLCTCIALSLPHEVRTALNGILGASSLLIEQADSYGGDELHNLYELIHSSATRLNRLVENYLCYAELEIAVRDSKLGSYYRSFCSEATSSLITTIAEARAERDRRSSDLHLELKGHSCSMKESHFVKIVEELVDNAFKYSKARSPVKVSTSCSDGFLELAVFNIGHGMTDEQVRSIGAFIQFDRTVFEQQGTGLGLVIVKRIAELYGGSLHLDSSPVESMRAVVKIPVGSMQG
ncbi:MAG: response regulator [Candidatus Xenobiia bacterium LiM19]